MEKVKFKKIKHNEIQALFVMISKYAETVHLKTSDFYSITVGSVLYELSNKKIKNILEGPTLKNYSFSLFIHQASALYIALQNSTFEDDFSKHVVRKIQTIIQEDFFNRI